MQRNNVIESLIDKTAGFYIMIILDDDNDSVSEFSKL